MIRPLAHRIIAPASLWIGIHAFGQHPGMEMHPLMPTRELFVRCELSATNPPAKIETRLAVDSASDEHTLKQTLELPSPAPAIRFLRYLPDGVLRQNVEPARGDEGAPAVELTIEGPSQSFRRWLIADDPERNRLTSFIATWRFMAVAESGDRDRLFELFRTEFTRDPVLIVSRPDGTMRREMPMTINQPQAVDDPTCAIRVREFLPDYAIDSATKSPINQSPRRRNPAAHVEIEMNGRTESRWIFAKFPEFSQRKEDSLPVHVALECAVEGAGDAPDFALVAIGERLEAWTRTRESTESRDLGTDRDLPIPGSPYRFRASRFVPKGVMIETYERGERSRGVPVLEVEYVNEKSSSARVWLPLGHFRRIVTPAGPMTLSLNVRGSTGDFGHP